MVFLIIDTRDHINFYFGMSKELDMALSVLKHYDLSLIQPGEYPDFPIIGSNIVLRVLEPDMLDDETAVPWEYHKHTIDVQYVLKGGSELIGYAPRSKLSGWEYDEKTDTAYTKDPGRYLPIRLEEHDFAIFFPQDAHRKIKSIGAEGYHKIVIKVPTSGFKIMQLKTPSTR